ncbi:MAG: branched-chain amino acid transaminase [Dehalococcoidia bacterium]|nr:branched-chain amino acid transaminase [Dehalococcoidia bacterium]
MPVYAYFNKQFVPLSEARIGVMTHCLHYGTGVFEGIRGNWNSEDQQLYLFRLSEHYERLLNGCRVLNINLPHTANELCQVTVELTERCGFREDIYVRPLAYKGSEALGVRLHNLDDAFMVFAFPWGPYLDTDGVRCIVSSWRRPSETPQAKITGLYVNNALAKTEAIRNDSHEAIMLTSDGYVSEGSGENIFLVQNGELVTPGVDDLMLVGITRDAVIKLARNELDMETIERRINRSELYTASECFLTGTAANITPVVEIDERKIGSGEAGEITKKLQKAYSSVIQGRDSRYREWCTPVFNNGSAAK